MFAWPRGRSVRHLPRYPGTQEPTNKLRHRGPQTDAAVGAKVRFFVSAVVPSFVMRAPNSGTCDSSS
jgi:hypothetical protein